MRERHRPRKPNAFAVCPLCERAIRCSRLHAHIQAERPKMRRETIVEIQTENPAWAEEAGACPRCWDSYRGVARVVRFMKQFKFPKRWRPMNGEGESL